jgi:tetratricopeptide (TPR) repeat protein
MAAEQRGRSAPRLLLWGAAGVLLVTAAWRSPVSPLAVQRADVLWHTGDPRAAAAHLAAAASQNPLGRVRRMAMARCAVLARTALNDPGQARLCLQQLAQDASASAVERGAAWAELADLLDREIHEPAEAAGAWRLAYESEPEAEAAAARLAASARALTAAGEVEAAFEVWDKVAKRFRPWEARARLAQGNLLLGKGRLRPAAEAFGASIDADPDELTLSLAQDGRKACEQRLAHLESALRTMANEDIPEALRKQLLEGPAEDDVASPP